MVSEERGLRAELLRQVGWVEPVARAAMVPSAVSVVPEPTVATAATESQVLLARIKSLRTRQPMVSMAIPVIRALMAPVWEILATLARMGILSWMAIL